MKTIAAAPSLLLAPITAGFVAVLVGFTSSVALVFQAAQAAGANTAQIGSWIGALSLGMGLCTLGLSLWYKQPVMIAWSTPGAALLITGLAGVSMPQAIGAFMFCALLITLCGLTGLFAKVMDKIPMALASAMLAGVLAKFALDAVLSTKSSPWLVLIMFASYLLIKRLTVRYAVPLVLVIGVISAALLGQMNSALIELQITQPAWVAPQFSWSVMLSVGVPLFLVTMASQNLPGVAVMRAAGYDTPVSPLLTVSGLVNMALAPFGCYTLNLAAITAAICMTPQAHPDKGQRYLASVACGGFYLIVAVFGASVAALFAAFPRPLVLTIAAIALLGTIGNGLASAMKDEVSREAGLVTFLVTLSGITYFGIGSAFWAIIAGSLVYLLRR